MDDVLCYHIGGSGLCAKDHGYRTGRLLSCLDIKVFVDREKAVHLLPLVLMKPLHLNIKDGIGIDVHILNEPEIVRKSPLVVELYVPEPSKDIFVILVLKEVLEAISVRTEAISDQLPDIRGQPRIAVSQRRKVIPLVLLLNFSG